MSLINIKTALMCLCLLGTLSLAACNTTEGLGQDMEAAGDTISDAARDNKNY
ncbi:MAG TPA: entericidin A/B family lipoprotein [Patescibacteria group bacterium]|nr:entericidin A/B family lipoprotein [Patescibacteria group bacterium]